jgi:hypothetical protein
MLLYPEVSIEDGVDDRVEGGVGVAQPVDKVIKLFFRYQRSRLMLAHFTFFELV